MPAKRPEPLQVIFDQIPGELQYLNHWILWRYVWKESKDGKPGKWDKPPFQPNGKLASSTAALTWSSFKTVKEAYERGLNLPVDDPLHFDGVGFVPAKVSLAENNLQFGDLDKCRHRKTGQLLPEANEDLDLINSYAEVSPSGTGIRFIAKGCPPYPQGKDGCKDGHFELYQGRHYLTITGHRLEKYPATIEKRPKEINFFYLKHFGESDAPKDAPNAETTHAKLTDDDIICLASEAVNSKKFMALMGGSIEGYPSHSEADQALCNLIEFYSADETQIDRIFRRSGLYRDKWERVDYREATIKKAISGAKEHYKGNGPKDFEPEPEPEPNDLKRKDVCNINYDDQGKEKSCTLSPTKAAGAIEKHLKLAMAKDDASIYYYENGIYHPDGERIVDMSLCNAATDAVDIKKLREVLRRVKNSLLCDPVTFDPHPYLLGVKNGVVDLSTGTFREYRPDDLITDQIDVTYDQAAKCPGFIQFLEDVVPVVIDRLMLVDWFAIHAIRLMFAYVMFLLGLGRNGKGIFERLMMRFYKEESFSEMPLEELNVKNNRFAGAALKGKRGQIVSEAGEERKPGSKRTIPTNYLKFSTGDGTIDSDQKGTIRTRFKPFYKATIDCNDMPLIGDSSAGWIERFCKANMPFKFVDNPTPDTLERKKDPHLLEKLTTDSELSGILNLILARTPELIRTRTIIKRSGAEMFAEYQKQSSSITTFLEMFCDYKPVSDKSKDIFLDLIFEKYEAWCDLTVADKVDGIRFGKAVKTFCKGTEPERVYDGDKKRRIYHGLSFDANRYQSHWDHYQTIKRPLKRVTGPLGPLNDEKYDVMWEGIVEKYGENKYETKNPSFLASMVPIAITKIVNGPDSDINGPENQINGPIAVCAVCGEDLTGHAMVEMGGKSYCARPGCGYPARDEAKAT